MADGIALLGYGCVGQGVADLLTRLGDQVPPLRHIVVADPSRPRDIVPPVALTTDPQVALGGNVSVVIEVNGEVTRNRTLLATALRLGKHVVTANKALLSAHLEELCQAAADGGAQLRYEAAVAGGVPVIRELLSLRRAHEVTAIDGVLNGSCNYVLDALHQGQARDAVLARATQLGYLEADPSADLDGLDAQRKLRLLASLALGGSVTEDDVLTASIAQVDAPDIAFAEAHGRVLRQVAHAHREGDGVVASVLPTGLPRTHPLAALHDVTNAVTLTTDLLGPLTLTGPGAGRYPTASAVVGDLLDVLTGLRTDVGPRPGWLPGLAGAQRHRWYVRRGDEQRLTEPCRLDEVDGDVVIAWN